MVKRVIIIWLLFALLISGAVCEQIFIQDTVDKIKEKTQTLEQQITVEYNGEPALKTINEMQKFWEDREKILCLIINYKELKDILMQMHRLEQTMLQNDEENTFIELTVLKYQIHGCSNVIGFNIQNVL